MSKLPDPAAGLGYMNAVTSYFNNLASPAKVPSSATYKSAQGNVTYNPAKWSDIYALQQNNLLPYSLSGYSKSPVFGANSAQFIPDFLSSVKIAPNSAPMQAQPLKSTVGSPDAPPAPEAPVAPSTSIADQNAIDLKRSTSNFMNFSTLSSR